MRVSRTLAALAVAAAATGGWATSWAAEHLVTQKALEFTPGEVSVKVGDTVRFENTESAFHNVYSLSDAKTFDLGVFGKGQSEPVVFDQAGVVKVECSIHPMMKMTINVEG